MARGLRCTGIAVIGVIAACALTPAASADVDCARSGTTLAITLTGDPLHEPGESILMRVGAADAITLRDINSDPVTCDGAPTTANVDLIEIEEGDPVGQAADNTAVRIENPDDFAPGATDAGDAGPLNPNEIEFGIRLGASRRDTVTLTTTTFVPSDPDDVARFTAGADGINFNDGPLDQDADVTLNRVERLTLSGGDGEDVISAAGGGGAGAAYPRAVTISGADDDDALTGGHGNDRVIGGSGGDDMDGGAGKRDTVDYSAADGPIRVDIKDGSVANDGGDDDGAEGARDDVGSDFEQILGGTDDDVLLGNNRRNRLQGGLGSDSMFGFGGNDVLRAIDGALPQVEERDKVISCGRGKRDRSIQSFRDPRPRGCENIKRKRLN